MAELLATAHREGHAWADMAILCRHHSEMDVCAEFLHKHKLPHQVRRNSSSVYDPAHDSIKVMALHASKGLEFPVVALVGAGRMPAEGEDEREVARLFYVGAFSFFLFRPRILQLRHPVEHHLAALAVVRTVGET